MLRLSIAIVCVIWLCAGCEEDEKPTPPTASATTAQAPSVAPSSAPPTGILSEEDFKALHVLREDEAPAPRGKSMELGSSGAYLSLPDNAKPPLPALVVIHEWWGLNGHIKHWSDRLAAAGYAALAVDLYGGKVATTPDDAMELMKSVDEKKARATLLEAFAFLGEDDRIKAQRRGSIGWCFGGKWSLELALAAPELDAAVVYYGHVATNPVRLASLQASLLGIFGNKDEGIPPKEVDRFEFGLEQAGDKQYKILRYDAEHAFANPSSGRYHEKAAAAAWKEVRAFLDGELKKGSVE
jgi:carboxymethylenebutenolidase